jgi:hypothetical protein
MYLRRNKKWMKKLTGWKFSFKRDAISIRVCDFTEELERAWVGNIVSLKNACRKAIYHWDTCGLYVIELVCLFLKFCF